MILEIKDANQKATIVAEVLLDLPEWFGLPESTQAYIDQSKDLPLFAATRNNEITGFITLKETSTETAKIHCMGIKKKYHRLGIGTQLHQAIESYAKPKYKYLQVKTVNEGHYKEYDQTIAFYQKMGFSKLEVFPTLWDAWNPCLILIKAL